MKYERPPVDDLRAWQRVVGAKDDGNPGNETYTKTIAWFLRMGYIERPPLPAEARSRVVAIARGELGIKPEYPEKYYRDAAPMYVGTKPNEKAWCGVFALWCLRQAGLTNAKWVDGVGFIRPLGLRVFNSIPEPGDIAYFNQGAHHAIVERFVDGFVHTIDGNAFLSPQEGVAERRRPFTDVSWYASIGTLVTP